MFRNHLLAPPRATGGILRPDEESSLGSWMMDWFCWGGEFETPSQVEFNKVWLGSSKVRFTEAGLGVGEGLMEESFKLEFWWFRGSDGIEVLRLLLDKGFWVRCWNWGRRGELSGEDWSAFGQ